MTSTPVAFSKVRMLRPFAADDAALHVVGGNVDGADRGFGRVRGGIALDRRRQDFTGLFSRTRRGTSPRGAEAEWRSIRSGRVRRAPKAVFPPAHGSGLTVDGDAPFPPGSARRAPWSRFSMFSFRSASFSLRVLNGLVFFDYFLVPQVDRGLAFFELALQFAHVDRVCSVSRLNCSRFENMSSRAWSSASLATRSASLRAWSRISRARAWACAS